MQRITTPNRALDLFGVGKDGFQDTPPNKTALDAAWVNAVQEEIARFIEDQGIALDAADLGQMAGAMNSWSFSGSPSIASGSTFTIATGATLAVANGTFTVANGATFTVATPATFTNAVTLSSTLAAGATTLASLTVSGAAAFNGNTTIGDAGADTLTVNATASFIEPVQVQSVVFEPDIPPAAARTLSAGPEYLLYRFGDDPGTVRLLHQSPSGWIYRVARLEDETALFSNNTLLTTGSTFPVGLGSTVLVIAEGWAQQTSAGTATLALQMDDGVATFSTIGSTRAVFVKDTSVATDWTYFRLEREVNPGGIARRYRLSFSTGLGSLKIRESSLRIVSRN